MLQRCLGRTANGHLDNATVRAAGSARGLVEAVCDERLRFLQSLRTWPVFGAGWVGACARCARRHWRWRTRPQRRRLHRPDTPAPGKGSVPLNDPARKTTTGGTVAAGGAARRRAVTARRSSSCWC
jgi:lysozyme family protein